MRHSERQSQGFTLVEILVVISIVAVIAAIAIPAFTAYLDKARIGRTVAELRSIDKTIGVYYSEHENNYPDSLADIGMGNLADPWGNPYQYLKIEGSGIKGKGPLRKDRFTNPLNSDYDLYCNGPDGLSQLPLTAANSRDDIVRANNGGFIGPAADF